MKEVIDLADEVLDLWDGHISTHYTGCYKRHVACFARLVKDVLEGEGDAAPSRPFWRAWHEMIARAGHYFWLPCDRCGESFGGHEQGWKARDAAIPGDTLLCPTCARRS